MRRIAARQLRSRRIETAHLLHQLLSGVGMHGELALNLLRLERPALARPHQPTKVPRQRTQHRQRCLALIDQLGKRTQRRTHLALADGIGQLVEGARP